MQSKNSIAFGAVAILFTVVGAVIVGALVVRESTNPIVCVEEKRIAVILSVQYRGASVQFEDGTVQEIDQGTFKPGEMRCTRWARVKK